MGPEKEHMTFEEWMLENADEVAQAQAFSMADIPDDPAPLGKDLSRAQAEFARMGFLMTDAEAFVLREQAAATMRVKKEYAEFSADERRILAKADENYLRAVRLRDNLQVVCQAMKNKVFSILNARNNNFSRGMDTES